jgi:hypothetical protein
MEHQDIIARIQAQLTAVAAALETPLDFKAEDFASIRYEMTDKISELEWEVHNLARAAGRVFTHPCVCPTGHEWHDPRDMGYKQRYCVNCGAMQWVHGEMEASEPPSVASYERAAANRRKQASLFRALLKERARRFVGFTQGRLRGQTLSQYLEANPEQVDAYKAAVLEVLGESNRWLAFEAEQIFDDQAEAAWNRLQK